MQRRSSSTLRSELAAFVAANVGRAQSDDVGALLGQAALLCDCAIVGEREPAAWQEALNAALAGDPRSLRAARQPGTRRQRAH